MPIYEYQCQACGKHFEEMQKFSDPALVNCPSCGKPKLKKLVSSTSFQLKGGGYYATDYKKPTEKPSENEKAEKAPEEKTDKTPPSSTETEKKADTTSDKPKDK